MRRMSGVEPYPIVVASQIGRSTLWTSRVTAPFAQPGEPRPACRVRSARPERSVEHRGPEGPATRYNK